MIFSGICQIDEIQRHLIMTSFLQISGLLLLLLTGPALSALRVSVTSAPGNPNGVFMAQLDGGTPTTVHQTPATAKTAVVSCSLPSIHRGYPWGGMGTAVTTKGGTPPTMIPIGQRLVSGSPGFGINPGWGLTIFHLTCNPTRGRVSRLRHGSPNIR